MTITRDLPTKTELTEIPTEGRCQMCGTTGPIVEMVDEPPPNRMCERCAIEYEGELIDLDEARP